MLVRGRCLKKATAIKPSPSQAVANYKREAVVAGINKQEDRNERRRTSIPAMLIVGIGSKLISQFPKITLSLVQSFCFLFSFFFFCFNLPFPAFPLSQRLVRWLFTTVAEETLSKTRSEGKNKNKKGARENKTVPPTNFNEERSTSISSRRLANWAPKSGKRRERKKKKTA